MPAEEGLGLDDLERLLPCRCHRCHDHQTEAVQRRELRPRDLTAQDEELLAEQGVFSDQVRLGPGQVCCGVDDEGARGWSSEAHEATGEFRGDVANQ